MQELTTLVFDLDGTLYTNKDFIDTIHETACIYLAEKLGISAEEADKRINTTKELIARESGFESTLSAACQRLECNLAEMHSHFAVVIDPALFLTPDNRVVSLIKRLGKCFDLCIYTNNNRILADKILTAIGLADQFRQIFSIDGQWRPKPDPEILGQLLQKIGISAHQALFIGDRYDVDLRLPKEFGCLTYLTSSIEDLLALEQFIDKEAS